MPPITIFDSFDIPIPLARFYPQDGAAKPSASISSKSTQAAAAPLGTYAVPYDIWNGLATDIINKHQSQLQEEHLAPWENVRYFDVEGDVVDASAVQLTNPVDYAFSIYHNKDYFSMSERTVGPEKNTARADKLWYHRPKNSPSNPKREELELAECFAILEYKRRNIIRQQEIEGAVTPVTVGTSFKGNSEILLKQGVNYYNRFKTKFIAFFDWEYLLLVVMVKAEENNGGDYCLHTLIKDRSQMRRGLLGFLERARQASLNENDDYKDLFNDKSFPTSNERLVPTELPMHLKSQPGTDNSPAGDSSSHGGRAASSSSGTKSSAPAGGSSSRGQERITRSRSAAIREEENDEAKTTVKGKGKAGGNTKDGSGKRK